MRTNITNRTLIGLGLLSLGIALTVFAIFGIIEQQKVEDLRHCYGQLTMYGVNTQENRATCFRLIMTDH